MTIAGIFFVTAMDAVVKSMSGTYPILQLVWVRYALQTLLTFALIWRYLPQVLHTRHPVLQVIRSLFLFGGTFCFFTGFSKIELAAATAILQTGPLFVAVGAHFVLGERLGLQRILGVVLGLIGTLIIIRPGTDVFSIYSLYPLAGSIGLSGYMITTRFLSRDEDVWTSFFYTTLFGAIAASAVVPFLWHPPSFSDLPGFAAIGILGTAGQYMFIRAIFSAEATVIAPFTYVSLLFATLYGMLFFNEFPSLWTALGAAIVVASGLYVWYRESRQRRF